MINASRSTRLAYGERGFTQKIFSIVNGAIFFNDPEDSKQMSTEIHLRFHLSSVMVKIHGTLLKKFIKFSQYQFMK